MINYIVCLAVILVSICGSSHASTENIEKVNDAYDNAFAKIHRINKKNGLNLFEGDILTDGNISAVRNGSRMLWENAEIPYVFASGLSPKAKTAINAGFDVLMNNTCLKFKERTNEQYFLQFVAEAGCYSYIGRTMLNGQKISIGLGCEETGIVIHEIMHALGFYHEQSRSDRDEYILINRANIHPGMLYNFGKIPAADIKGQPYDQRSLMHFDNLAFSSNGQRTLISRSRNVNTVLGQKDGPSELDIKAINLLYRCGDAGGVGQWSSWSGCKRTRSRSNTDGVVGQWSSWSGYKQTRSRTNAGNTEMEDRPCTPTSTSTSGSHTGTNPNCKDKNEYCKAWSSRSGYCKKGNTHYEYMKSNCPRSCEFC